ncbi:MAG TPA: alpha/beta hydrolase [Acidimicrobiales bacterium]
MASRADAIIEPSRVPPGRAIELPGRGTTFIREVAGPPGAPTVMLLHGLSATGGLNWLWAFEPLGRHYRVIAIDHRGHGHGIRTRRFRLADCADDVAALADVLGIDAVVPVGYSMGGPIAQLLWHRHRSLVRGMVLCATSRNFRGNPREIGLWSMLPFVTAGIRTAPGMARRAFMTRVMERRLPQFAARDWVIEEMSGNDPAVLAEAASALARFSSHEWIGGVDVPTAVVLTRRDRLVPPSRQLKMAEAIPGARVIPVDGDHSVCVSDPSAFVPALQTALTTVMALMPRAV